MHSLIVTAKLNHADPHAWLADVGRRIADRPASRLQDLLPWNWQPQDQSTAAAAEPVPGPRWMVTIRLPILSDPARQQRVVSDTGSNLVALHRMD